MLSATDAAGLYRSLRQLPPSLVAVEEHVHERLAARAYGLARAVAFSYPELTSVLYSCVCLYPDLWSEPLLDTSDAMNPRRRKLLDAYSALVDAWQNSDSASAADPRTQRQAAAVSAILKSAISSTDMETTGVVEHSERMADGSGCEVGASRSRPVAIELLNMLADLGYEQARGPFWEGTVEVHAAIGKRCVCFMPEDAYFQRASGFEIFSEAVVHDQKDAQVLDVTQSGLELSLERAVDVHLLKSNGWEVTAVPYRAWRQLSASSRRKFAVAVFS